MRHVIIGNGPAAIAAAEALREQDRRCEITLVSQENVPFYTPCPLAEYVEDSVPREHLFLRQESFYRELGIELRLGQRATGLDTVAHTVTLINGTVVEQISYDRLLIATGASAIMPPIPGLRSTPGVFALKTLADAESILARLPAARRAVVIGSGFIGLEAAQALVRKGLQVTVVEAQSQVLPQMLDGEMAGLVEARLTAHGIDVRTNSPAQAIIGGETGVTAVKAGGEEIACELVVCAAGVRPNLGWIESSDIATAKGILVDTRMATNVADVYAAGDVVEGLDTLGTRLVLPNWPNAVNSGRVAGMNMAGVERHYRGLDAINVLRIFDLPVASFGVHAGGQTLTHADADKLRKLTLKDGRIVGGQFYGNVDNSGLLLELMNKRDDVSALADRLVSPDFGLGWLLPHPPLPLRKAA